MRITHALPTLLLAALILPFVSACSGGNTSTLPLAPIANVATNVATNGAQTLQTAHSATNVNVTTTSVSGTIAAIDAGGSASGAFAADAHYSGSGLFTYATAHAIDLSAVQNPAPQNVYQTGREGATIGYTISGLKTNAPYALRLHFAEPYFGSAGQRLFDIVVNGTRVATNYDIVAAAGATNKAVVAAYAFVADAAGHLNVTFVGANGSNARIDGIEIRTAASSAGPVATPLPTIAPTAAPTSTPSPTPSPTPTPVATPAASTNVAPAGTRPFPNGPFDNAVTLANYDPNSATYLARVMGGDYFHIGKLQFGTQTSGPTDDGTPIYIAHNSDPVYTIHCMYYTNCPLEGVQAHIPVGARPSGNLGYTSFTDTGHDDQHMAVRNVDSGVEIDTWLTPQPSDTGGTLAVGYGGAYPFASGGYNQPGGATAAGFALANGRIRAVDLLAGSIPYAIFMITPCENGYVPPASGSDSGPVAGCPPIGSHLWLDSTPAEVAASGAAPDFQVILNALHQYGGYIGDRCTSCNLTVGLESGLSVTSFGKPNPWSQIAAHFPSETSSGTPSQYHILISSGNIDLSQHLHFLTN